MQFLSTLSLRRATTAIHVIQGGVDISIHALLAESDPPRHWHGGKPGHFYPRSPCGERQCARGPLRGKAPFLSTLSLRRATILAPLYNPDIVFLSTLSLRRATRAFAVYNPPGGISIHALLAESDVRQGMATLSQPIFLSTLSLRRATSAHDIFHTLNKHFYPRSPCGERPVRVVRTCWSPYFYPRSPCGERHGQDVLLPAALEFLSTLSLRRATIGGSTNQTHKINFYPRSPCGERRSDCRTWTYERLISIHALLAESDLKPVRDKRTLDQFLSTLSLRRATSIGNSAVLIWLFLSTLSLRRATRG